jgi:hypothetical protein
VLRANREFGLVDMVWVAVRDARWHTAEEIASSIQSPIERVALVLSFLERYGFARSSAADERRFRVDPGTPSPRTTARSLRFLLRGLGCN